MNLNTPIRRAAATGSIVLALGGLTIVPAAASHGGGGGVERSGNCSASTDWKLEAKAEDGRIEVEAEIDSSVSGQVWTWRILHNGGVSAKGRATTHAPSGSFEIRRLLVNSPGTDNIGLRSTNTTTGETCSGNLQF